MRDLLFKNLTSVDKKRKVIISSEVTDKAGLRSVIKRHFICVVREVKSEEIEKPLPYLYVLKERNTDEKKEKFFCKLKGSIFAINKGRVYLILFMHSLKITLRPVASIAR
ncbi:MAG: hypothetical protein DRP74_02965 [Candidatus Omnitrophota bacterium]|nr:MAG: hypothetical protein DRP74_02965 [Candidatus Omnitrophota bacterium]